MGLNLTLPTCSKKYFTATAIVVKHHYTITKIHQKLWPLDNVQYASDNCDQRVHSHYFYLYTVQTHCSHTKPITVYLILGL